MADYYSVSFMKRNMNYVNLEKGRINSNPIIITQEHFADMFGVIFVHIVFTLIGNVYTRSSRRVKTYNIQICVYQVLT